MRTVYFRREFDVAEASAITCLAAIVNYDNGAIIYFNGEEVARINMPDDEIGFHTWASSNAGGVSAVVFENSDIAKLHNGTNLCAVEMHQAADDSSDMKFDLRLIAPAPLIEYGEDWYYYDAGQEPQSHTVGIGDEGTQSNLIRRVELFPNYPNPFNPVTNIRYQLAEAGDMSLTIFDMLGREVSSLVREKQNAGEHVIRFDGSALSSGLYICQLKVGVTVLTQKILLLK